MPHSSGGGSHSGGSHSSSSHSHSSGGGSHSSGPRIVRSNKPFSGSHRYVYYRHHRPHYYYSNETKSSSDGSMGLLNYLMTVGILSIFIIIGAAFLTSVISISRPVAMPSDNEVRIEDRLDILSDSDESALRVALESFRDETGVVPAVITDSNDAWSSYYTDLENYAYDLYVNNFEDEKHWLIVYTSDLSSEFEDWHFEGMIGNDVSSAISSSAEDEFTTVTHESLLARTKYSVAEAIAHGFDSTLEYISKPHIEWIPLIFIAVWTGIPTLMLLAATRDFIKERNVYSKGVRCPDNPIEVKCDYCGQVYIKGIHLTCPYCGAHLSTSIVDYDAIREEIEEPVVNVFRKIMCVIFTIMSIVATKNFIVADYSMGAMSVLNLIPNIILGMVAYFGLLYNIIPVFWNIMLKSKGELITGKVNKINNGSSETSISVDFPNDLYIRYTKPAKTDESFKSGQTLNFKKIGKHYLLVENDW